MRISIFLNNDLESNIALNSLIPEISKHELKVFISEKVGPTKHSVSALQYLDFLEREFIHTKLFPKIEEQATSGYLSFSQLNQKYNLQLSFLSEVTSRNTLDSIKQFKGDLFLSIRFGKIFKGEILSLPPLGIINLHSGILPDYKGVLGTLRAFMDKRKTIGTTIHYIRDNTIDTGEIILVNELNAMPGKSILWHIVNLYPQSIKKLSVIINQLSHQNTIECFPQGEGGDYFSFPDEFDFAILKQQDNTLFDLVEYSKMLNYYYQVDPLWVIEELRKSSLPEKF